MTNAAEEAAIARIVADVKALEMARGGKGSSTLRPGEKAEQVEPGQMVEVSNHSCLPQQKVEVVAAESAWSLGMPLAVFPFLGNCRDDPALCCYACCFPVCLHAEIAEYNGIEGLCHTKSALAQACCVECTAFSMIASFPLSGGLCFPLLCCVPSTRGARTTVGVPSDLGRRVAPDPRGEPSAAPYRFHRRCVYTAYFTMVRDAFKRKYGLPDDEFFGGHLTWSSYLSCGTWICSPCYCCMYGTMICSCCAVPCHGFTPCAGYQNGHFFKHASPIKRDYECCLYKHVGIAIFGTGQMPQPSAPRGAPPAADSCHYE